MKLRNVSNREIKIKFLKLDGSVDPKDRDRGGPIEIVIAPQQLAEVPDIQWDKLRDMKPYAKHLEKGNLVEEGSGGTIVPGDGDAGCPLCLGRGFLSPDGRTGTRCRCVYKRDVIANVRKIWSGFDLMKAPVLKKRSPLHKVVGKDAWITAKLPNFRAHLRHVAVRQGPHWFARVRSDVDMMTGWFASAKAKSIEIFDADVAEAVARDMDIHDLAEPPDLLVMVLGAKRARNVATPEVLMEVLSIREHVDKKTWVVDQPTYSIDHDVHRCSSPEVLGLLEGFTRIQLDAVARFIEEPDEIPDGVEDVTHTRGKKAKPSALAFRRQASGRTKHDSRPHNVSEDDDQ